MLYQADAQLRHKQAFTVLLQNNSIKNKKCQRFQQVLQTHKTIQFTCWQRIIRIAFVASTDSYHYYIDTALE